MNKLAIAIVAFMGTSAYAADATVDNFMCVKIRQGELSDLKLGLIEKCDLNKQFSISGGENTIGKGSYTYCCFKKK